jgi:hypothetical protein
MLNEVTRLTKGDFSKFKEKKYQVERVRFLSLGVVKKGVVVTFDTRDKAIDFLNGLDKRSSDEESYFRIKEVDR